MITLQIKRNEFEAIASGKKKIEWRNPSKFNKKLLLSVNEQGQYTENTEVKEIQFVNGYRKDAPRVVVEVLLIRPYKFTHNIDEPENLFRANENECSIGIHLGKVIN